MIYTLYHDTGPHTHTDDPKMAIAHGKARGRRLSMPNVRIHRVPPLPRLTLPRLQDQLAETVYQTLATSIARHDDATGSCARVVGKADEDGYWCAATDGHRALMRAGDKTERERFPAKTARQFTPGPGQFVLNRPFADVWRRMSVLADGWIDLELTSDALTLSTRDRAGDTATEVYTVGSSVPLLTTDNPIHFSLNPAYLAPLLRYWPITVAYRPRPEEDYSEPPIVFSPASAGWRYILMAKR